MKEVDVLVIGGGPAAVITAVVAKQMNTDKHVVVVRNSPTVVIPCGIPYIFNTLKTVENDIMPDGAYKMNDIELIIDEAIDGDIDAKVIKLKTGQEIKYKKLVLATGSLPKIPKFIPGYEKEGVFYIYKNFDYLNQMLEKIANMKKIVIIGGGFIGMELADEFISQGEKEITIIEMEPHCLIQAFDQEFCEQVEEKFKDAGVNILTNTKLTAVMGDNKVEYVEIDGKKKIKAEAVIFSIGSRPNVELATKLGIRVDEKYGIWADEYLRTSHPDVFAVGDCTAKTDFFTRRPAKVMLASTACAEARIAGANLFALQVVRENKGTIGIFSTYLQGFTIATAGLTERMAKDQGFDIITATSSSKDRHPGKFVDTSEVKVKLTFSKYSGIILGGQVIGGKSVGEMINAIGIAIQEHMSESDLFTLQFGTHPLLTSAPTTYPVITAAQKALVELKSNQK